MTWADKPIVTIGSKAFTENYILGELAAQIVESTDEAQVTRKLGMGETLLVFEALKSGEIQIYPEYTGTISRAILKKPELTTHQEIDQALRLQGIISSPSLGFNNTYVMSMRKDKAKELGITRISDLKQHHSIRPGLTPGFLDREDGWKGLHRAYGITELRARSLEHGLAYEALLNGKIDLIDAYATDAKLYKYDLLRLQDDLGFFPEYQGLYLVTRQFTRDFPNSWARLQSLENLLNDDAMTKLNARVELDGLSFAEAAQEFLKKHSSLGFGQQKKAPTLQQEIWQLSLEHLFLVGLSLIAAMIIGIPLGILADRYAGFGQLILTTVGMVQTIPSLALLCFLIPLFGIGTAPALVALFLYALLPIVRSTHAGLSQIPAKLIEVSDVLGLDSWQKLWRIQIPMASISILAGIKTSAVINVGTATLAAFIGGGGLGTLIVRGLALNQHPTILAGAIPAALMAIGLHLIFEWSDRFLVPRGLVQTR